VTTQRKNVQTFLKIRGDYNITDRSLNHNRESLNDQKLQSQYLTGIVKRKVNKGLCTKPSKIFCKIVE